MHLLINQNENTVRHSHCNKRDIRSLTSDIKEVTCHDCLSAYRDRLTFQIGSLENALEELRQNKDAILTRVMELNLDSVQGY